MGHGNNRCLSVRKLPHFLNIRAEFADFAVLNNFQCFREGVEIFSIILSNRMIRQPAEYQCIYKVYGEMKSARIPRGGA